MTAAVFDLESDGFLPDVTTVWCGVVRDIETNDIKKFGPDAIDDLLICLSSYSCLIGHNCIAYDFPVLRKLCDWNYDGQVIDTLLMSRLQRPNRKRPNGYVGKAPHSVEAWGYRLGKSKQEHEDWTQYSDQMLKRCHTDVDIQYEIYRFLRKEGQEKDWEKAHRLNANIFKYLQLQEETGWTIDREHLDGCVSTLERWMGRINRALIPHLPLVVDVLETKKDGQYAYVKKPFKQDGTLSLHTNNYFDGTDYITCVSGPYSRIHIRTISLDSTLEIKDFLLNQGWQPEKWNEKNGQRTSANLSKDDPFTGIKSALGRLVVRRIQCRQRRSVLEGWKKLVRSNGRLPTKVAGIATTGRLRHAIIVNIPSPHSGAFFAKQMRQCFIPQAGWVMVGVDSKGNQMRQLAARMQDDVVNVESVKEFTDAVLYGNSEDGTDLHALNQKRSGAPSRSRAKNFFYGCVLFGAGDKKTGEMLECSPAEARAIKEKYFEEMPALQAVIDGLKLIWKATAKKRWNSRFHRMEYYDGYIRGLDGRPILVPYEKDLLCYALQSDEAVHMGGSYVIFHKKMKAAGYTEKDWACLIFMHDEIQFECRPEIADIAGQLCCDSIRIAGEFYNIQCPHEGSYLKGQSWYSTH